MLKSGIDISRTEWIISGTLRVNGPVTFTSQSGTPGCEDWYGLRFMPGSAGYLNGDIVEYGVHAVEIDTTNRITVAGSTLRYNCHLFVGRGDPVAFYHLRQDSPCIDAGASAGLVPDHDYDGETRPYSATWDIGFDEFTVAPAQPVGGFTIVFNTSALPVYLPVVLRPYQ